MIMAKKLFMFFVCFYTHVFANICFTLKLPDQSEFEFEDNIQIESYDGIKIAANLFTPIYTKKRLLPTIIFVNSWTMEEHQYIKQATALVKKGYQVFSYSARGWGCSEGLANVIGPKDVKDLSKVIDWIYENTNVDKANIGIAGISYGGGMTLMALAKEPRIKTGFAMSAWASLSEAMYHQESPRIFWSSMLMGTGLLLGRIDERLKDNFKKLIFGKDEDKVDVLEWADVRSPIKYISEINKRSAPVYIANNLGDNLFQPNNVIRYFKKLTSPKILDLNQGTHATGELSGLFTFGNYTFKKLHSWFDYWLKDETENTDLVMNSISMQRDLSDERDIIKEDKFFKGDVQRFYLGARNMLASGDLTVERSLNNKRTINTIRSGLDTFASTGVPLISAIIDGHFNIPVYSYMPLIDPFHGIRFKSETLEKTLKIRGIPKLRLNMDSNGKPFQIIAYLYDVNKYGAAKLITHGVYSGKYVDGQVDMEIVATAYDIPSGNHLSMVIDTKDILYSPSTLKSFNLNFSFGPEKENILDLPVL